MRQTGGKKNTFLYVIILLLLAVVGFLFYQLYDVKNIFDSLLHGKDEPFTRRSQEENLVKYEEPSSRKSSYTLQSQGRSQSWNPYNEMERMQEHINQVLAMNLERFHAHESDNELQRFNFNLNAEVAEDSRYYVLNISIPNVKPDSIEVNATEKQLQLKGINEESVEEKDAKGNVVQSEMKSTSFFRSINFPEKVDPSSLEKKIENGILQIKLKKLNAKD